MEFTKEEISLCKQIAERYRKEIVFGDWFYDEGLKKTTIYTPYPHGEYTLNAKEQKRFNYIPLWTISDCLEFLEEREFTYVLNFIKTEQRQEYELSLYNNRTHENQLLQGKTRKIVAQKAVLAVLGEKK